jgi:hypothetical protein
MHQATRAGNVEIAKAILPVDICSHRRYAGVGSSPFFRLTEKALNVIIFTYPLQTGEKRWEKSHVLFALRWPSG